MEPAEPKPLDGWASQHRALEWSAWILAAVSLSGLGFRLWLGPLPWWFVTFSAMFGIGFLSGSVVLRMGGSSRWAGLALVSCAGGLIATVALGQGGQDAPLLIVLPVLPVVASFLVGGRAGWVMAGLICLLMAALVVLPPQATLIPSWALDGDLARSARAVWIGITALVLAVVTWLYDKRSSKLRHSLEIHATKDHLTGLANRRQFDEQFAQECRRAARDRRPLSVILMDLDYFKGFNDTYGHQLGDQCLVAVSWALGTRIRRAGDLIARIGGEEFVALFPDADQENAVALAESMRLAVRQMEIAHTGSPAGIVTVSLGVASGAGPGGLVPDELLARADEALYRAKKAGRDRTESATPASGLPESGSPESGSPDPTTGPTTGPAT